MAKKKPLVICYRRKKDRLLTTSVTLDGERLLFLDTNIFPACLESSGRSSWLVFEVSRTIGGLSESGRLLTKSLT